MAFLQPFLDLLPYRCEQTLSNRALRKLRVQFQRSTTRPQGMGIQQPSTAADHSRRQLFIDVAVISKHDAGTGIQRVVRALALALIKTAGSAWEIRFVAATRRHCYHEIAWPDQKQAENFEPIQGKPGDIFLGLDYSLDTVRRHRKQLASFRRNGGALWFLVHDLLPLEKPEWFSRNTVIRYKAWLGILAGIADGFLCNSQQTELDLRKNLTKVFGLSSGYDCAVLPMGPNIAEVLLPAREHEALPTRFDLNQPFFLMVGTLEPRKGHFDIVAAFNQLWRNGAQEKLVLVGRMGWEVAELKEAIVNNPERDHRLFWFDDVADAELYNLYELCSGGIIASYGEGFGLPLIEMLGHNKPVLARDLAIFRSHESAGVRYFPMKADTQQLCDHIQNWMKDVQDGAITVKKPQYSWQDSAQTLMNAIDPHS